MNVFKLFSWAVAVSLLLTATTGAAAQTNTEVFIKAQATFEKGLRGSESDNEGAAEQFRQLNAADPANPLFQAYYGSTFTLKARDAWAPWKKLKLGEQGLDLIDKALKKLSPEHDHLRLRQVPMSIETRLVAVTTFLTVPDVFFHRYDHGKALLVETMRGALFAQSPPQTQARFFYQAAVVAQKEGARAEEIAHLKRVIELDPLSLDAPAAKLRLTELGL